MRKEGRKVSQLLWKHQKEVPESRRVSKEVSERKMWEMRGQHITVCLIHGFGVLDTDATGASNRGGRWVGVAKETHYLWCNSF